jgi:hypothetical protein
VLSTNAKGAIAELKIAAAATELGIAVLRPMQEQGRYDLAFDIGERMGGCSASGARWMRPQR